MDVTFHFINLVHFKVMQIVHRVDANDVLVLCKGCIDSKAVIKHSKNVQMRERVLINPMNVAEA